MLIAVAAVVVVAVILFGLLLAERKKSAAAELTSTNKLQALENELANTRTNVTGLEEALESSDSQRTSLESELTSVNAELVQAQDANTSLQAAADELSEAEHISAERIAVLEIDLERLQNGLAPIEPQTLWELELQRSERTWRHMVAVSPDFDESPFSTSPDLLRLAVEVEAAALKEEAGAFLSVDWQAAPVEDPARSHLILRLAQEMLAEAAREPVPACLSVEGTGAVTLTMSPSEDDDVDFTLDVRAPAVSGQLIEFDTEHPARIIVTYGHELATGKASEGDA